ncbi:hypothetical protein GCM10007857_66720 [Bradyrhizobium iriomotense]|uniref:Uncharacterized protein n=1 Tax=Bradyrhizobium iriomotense TaxID=441950 RepID=A0ABQ6B860_9BRAD|nr:hypothetical protein GCM10007857_66720 [Bradyrhizobium iriomotense]
MRRSATKTQIRAPSKRAARTASQATGPDCAAIRAHSLSNAVARLFGYKHNVDGDALKAH